MTAALIIASIAIEEMHPEGGWDKKGCTQRGVE